MQITIEKRHLFIILATIVFLAGTILVFAYGGNNPSVFGHSVGEINWDTQIPTIKVGSLCLSGDCRSAYPSGTGGSGTVTSVGTGAGITGGPITTTGIISADTSYLQRRVSGTCGSGNAIRVINSDGTVTCQSTAGVSSVDCTTLGSDYAVVKITGATPVCGIITASQPAGAWYTSQGTYPCSSVCESAGKISTPNQPGYVCKGDSTPVGEQCLDTYSLCGTYEKLYMSAYNCYKGAGDYGRTVACYCS